MTVLLWIVYALFGIAAVLTVVRIILGPSILDRAVASDVLLTEVMCVLGADMVINHDTDALPVLLVIAAVGVFGSVAIARFVARRDTEGPDGPADEGSDADAPTPGAAASGSGGSAAAASGPVESRGEES